MLFRLRPLIPVNGNLNAHNDVIDKSVLPPLLQQFGQGHFSLSTWHCSHAQSHVTKWFGVEELD